MPLWLSSGPAGGRAFLITVALFAYSSFFQQLSAAPRYFILTWQVENGLPDNSITAIEQTQDGYIWVGTRSGLARFDGVKFNLFDVNSTPELQSSYIATLFRAADGTLWIGHEHGEVTCYRDGKFRAVPVQSSWTGGKIREIGEDKAGDIWLMNESGELARVRDGFTIPALPGGVTHLISMARDRTGGFWIQRDSEVSTLIDDRLSRLNFGDAPPSPYIQGIGVSRGGGLWVTSESRLRKWNDNKWTEDLGPAPWEWSPAHTMIETRSKTLAVATANQGLYLVFPGSGFLQFSRTNGLSTDWVTSLCEDREGNLWVGTGNGLCVLRQVNVSLLSPPDQWQGRGVLSVTDRKSDGSMWIGTEGAGLYSFRDGNWTNFSDNAGLHRYIWSLNIDRDDRIWAGTWGGGIFVKNGNYFNHPPELQDLTFPVTALLNASRGGWYAGTESGLLWYNGGEVTWLARKPELNSPDVRAVREAADGTIWFGMSGGGLASLKDGKLRQFRRQDGLSSDFVQCLHLESNGTLWIGTFGGGLNRLKNGRFAVLNKRNQKLPNDIVCDIEEDGLGYFWISTHAGIVRVSQDELDRCADGETNELNCLTYGLNDGLPTLECSGGFQPAGCRTEDGRLWFPTVKGLVGVDPGNVKINRLPPPVVIEEMRVDDRAVTNLSNEVGQLRIAPGRRRFEFDYTALSFVAPQKVRFRYRLEGLEPNWVEAGARRVADFSYIPPGNYVFHVIACNNDGIWNDTGSQIAFTVLPYFWQTWWFRVLVGAIMVCGGGAIVWLDARRRMHRKLERLERQQALERERTRIAKDIHDDLGASLTRISLLSQSARRELDRPPEAAAQLDRIYGTARELTRAMDEIVWAVNPRHDTLDSLASYLGKFAQDYLRSANIRCRLKVPDELPAWPVTAEIRHSLFLAFKEALHNVVKHAGASEVRVTLTLGDSAFTLTVEDDGCGFSPDSAGRDMSSDPDRIESGYGLTNMQRRVTEIGGRYEIQSAPGAGTRIKLDVPAKAP
jgi:signal transduction histidine kinase/ligand-binding sensor domain-containing protein